MAQIENIAVETNQAQVETPVQENVAEQASPAPAPVEAPAEPVKPEKEAKEHPKWDAFKAKAKKVGKWVGLGAAVVGGLFVANKIGQAQGQVAGFDQACDSFAKSQPDPIPELPMNNIDGGVDVTQTPVEVPEVGDLSSIEITQF